MQHNFALAFGFMPRKKGPRGRRSPCPEWWVTEANRRLAVRGVTKKQLAKRLSANAFPISEMMVLRCLHEDEAERIPTIEALDAISDALGMPRPVVVADTLAQALELHAVVAFGAADADRLRISTEVDRHEDLQSTQRSGVDGSDGRKTRNSEVDEGRTRAPKHRPATIRRVARTR